MTKTLGEALRACRLRRGDTQERAAFAIGCDVATLGRWERHRIRVSTHREALRAYLGVDPDTFADLLLHQAEAVARRRGRAPPAPAAADLDRAETLMRMWNAREMVLARRAVCRLARDGRPGPGGPQSEILGFFEQLHHFLERGEISWDYVWLSYGCFVDLYVSILADTIRTYQEHFGDGSWYAGALALKRGLDRWTREQGARVPAPPQLEMVLREEEECTALFLGRDDAAD